MFYTMLLRIASWIKTHTFLLFLYIMSNTELQTLSEKVDARLTLIDQLKSGLEASNELVEKLNEANSSLDTKISDLIQKAADTSKLDEVTQQVTSKNTELQGLVNKVTSVLR